MADMDLSTQLDALDEVNQNVTDRPKGFTGESGLLGDIYADGIADKFKTHLRNKRDVDNMDSMIASEAESHRFDASEWEKEVKYRQDLLEDPSISGQDVDLLKKNLEYAQKRYKEASELYAKTNSLRARNLDDLPGTALERGLFRGLGEAVRTRAAVLQNVTESLGFEETARGIGIVRDIIGPDDTSKEYMMRPLEWSEAKGVGGIASYVGEKTGNVLPWLAAFYASPSLMFAEGTIAGQGDMRRALEARGFTDKATIRKTSYIYGTLMGGLLNVVPWAAMKGLTPGAMKAFQGTVGQIAARMATNTAVNTTAMVFASGLASWAEEFGVNYASGEPINWKEAIKKSIEMGGEAIIPGLLFGMFGEGHKAIAGGYKVAKGGAPEQPQTAPVEPVKTQPTPEEIKAAEERKLAKLATEQTPEATTERQTIRSKQQEAEKQALIDQHDAISKELEALDKEMAAIESNQELSEVERAALTAEANLKRSPLIEQSDALVAEMEKFTVREPGVESTSDPQAAAEPQAPRVTDQERADFTAILRTDAARDTWAEKLGVTPEKLADLVEDAKQRGLVRIDRHGVARRTGKLYFSEPEKPITMPDGEVAVKTELAQEKWGEMQAAVDEAVNELTDSKVKAVVKEKIEALRSTSDQKYAMAKGQSGGSLSERVFGPQSSVSEAGGGYRGTAAREPGNKAAPTTSKAGGSAEGARTADARILRSEAATIREDGTPIVGRRIRGKVGYREGNNIQRVGTTRKLGLLPDHETLVTAEKLHSGDDRDVVAKLTYRVFDKGTAPDKGSPRDSAYKALIELKQHNDGAWEIAYVEVAPRARGEGLATKLYTKVAKDIGIKQMSPSGQLTNDGYAYWSKRSPESVKWHQPSLTEEGMYYSPRYIKDEIARLEGYVKNVDKRTYLSDADKAEFVSSYRQEISDLQRMWESLPDEAKTQQATDSMFALRGFYSPAIRAVEKINQTKGTGAQFLAQIIKSPGVRREELDWMGVDEFLREKKSVTKQEVIDFMRSHQMDLREVVLSRVYEPAELADLRVAMDNAYFDIESERRKLGLDPYGRDDDERIFKLYDAYNAVLAEFEKINALFYKSVELHGVKFDDYAIPGGENYREILIEIPGLGSRYDDAALSAIEKKIAALESSGRSETEIDSERRALYAEESRLLNEGANSTYESKHFGRQEIVHIRADDRTGPGGEKILFANEVQSDIHQQGRIHGYKSDEIIVRMNEIQKEIKKIKSEEERANKIRSKEIEENTAEFDREITKLEFELDELVLANRGDGGRVKVSNDDYFKIREGLSERIDRLIIARERVKDPILNKYRDFFARSGEISRGLSNEYNKLSRMSTDAPYKGEAWLELALKRLLFHAVENGYDAISWARSDQIAKAVGADPEKLSIQYDQKIGRFLDKYTKKWGGKVEKESGIIADGEPAQTVEVDANAPAGWGIVEGDAPFVGGENQILRITPEMRASVMEGQPLSARGGDEASILGKADPDNLIAYLAAKAIENEAAQTGRTPIAEAIRTARHEVMEIAKAIGLISEGEWARLIKDAKAKGWVESQGVRDAYEGMYKEGMSPDQLEQLLLKEAIFEKFADFEAKGKPPRNYAERVYQRIVDFFKSTMRGMREKLGIESSDDIFHKFDTGEMKKRFAEAGIERPKAAEDGLYAARKAPPQPTPLDLAFDSIRSELGLVAPTTPWKGRKQITPRQHAVAIAQTGGAEVLRLYGKELAPALAPHRAAIEGMAMPWSTNPFEEGFSRFFNDFILRPDNLRQRERVLFDDFKDTIDAANPHLLESIDHLHDLARGRVKKELSNKLIIPGIPDVSTASWIKHNIKPANFVASVKGSVGKAVLTYEKNFQPELVSDKAFMADAQFARYKAASAQEKDAIERAQDAQFIAWTKRTVDERMQYIRDIELGAPQATPEMAALANRDRKLLEQAMNLEKIWGSKAGYIEDYFPHIWKNPDKARKILSEMTKALGPTWFQKARYHETIQEGLKSGLELKTTNPAELVTLRLLSGVDMRMRVELLRDLDRLGLARNVVGLDKTALQQLTNAGWEIIRAPNMDQWGIAPDVQALWKNAVDAKGLWGNEGAAGSIFRGWMAFKNIWVPIKLSLSAFHPLHVLHINISNKLALAFNQIASNGDIFGALKTATTSLDPRQGAGFDARMAWVKPHEERTGYERSIVELMKDGGFVPQLSEQLRISARRGLAAAYNEGRYLSVLPLALRRATEVMQSKIFENWIPGVKAAAYLQQAQLLITSNPHLLNDQAARRVALRAIAKSVDNRFGEMFYGNLFWNRTIKDTGIASFLSLGWNLGFAREFLGAPIKAATYPFKKAFLPSDNPRLVAADANNKIAFSLIYMSTFALFNGAMTYAFTGEQPEGYDFIFARIGGKNPDGSDRRVTNMSYLREIPMLQKHVEERGAINGTFDLIYNKMMIQPIIEIVNNRDYWGYKIYDEESSLVEKTKQFVSHTLSNQLFPITFSGAQRAAELSGTYEDKSVPLSFLGFGPAPAYIERSPLENRIRQMYKEYVAPLNKPYEQQAKDEEKRIAKQELRRAIRDGNEEAAAVARAKAKAAGATPATLTNKRLNTPSGTYLFSRLPPDIQEKLLQNMSAEEMKTYRKYANRRVRRNIPMISDN